MQNKKRIGVLFGGQSGEHEISRISAYNVMAVIDQDKFHIGESLRRQAVKAPGQVRFHVVYRYDDGDHDLFTDNRMH